MLSNDESSPISKRKRYQIYKHDSNLPIPLRTLDRWASRNAENEKQEASALVHEEKISDNESSENSSENHGDTDISDDNSIDECSNSEHDSGNDADENLNSDYNYDDDDEDCNDDVDADFNDDVDDNDEMIRIEDGGNYGSIGGTGSNEIIDNNDNYENQAVVMLYENSSASVDQSVFNLLDFYIRHKLSKAALREALRIFLAALPTQNRMPKTVFKLLQYVDNIALPCEVIKHHYCKKCLFHIGIRSETIMKCTYCDATGENMHSFFEFNIADQLKYFFEKRHLAEKLRPLPLLRDENVIGDMMDGSEYIRVNSRENRDKYDLTLILNTDGLSLVESGSSHCWPLMYTIAELPEHLRESFIIILGLWYDKDCKPQMNTFLQPFCLKLKQLYTTGINWIHPKTGEAFTTKVVAPLIIADAPARADLQNTLRFNGIYGCNICEMKTENCNRIAGKKTTRMYPFEENESILRTNERMIAYAKLRELSSKPYIEGVKGYSILSCSPLIDIGTCVLPEYMHSVLLGVVKQYINLLLNKPGPWNIKKIQ